MADSVPASVEIVTPRCRLRRPHESDIPHVWSATRIDGFNDGMRWDPPERIEDLKAPLRNAIAAWQAGTHFTFTVENRVTSEFIGRISIRRESGEHEWSIGFWIHPSHQRNGYAKEAATAIIGFGFDRLGAESITAAHATWNQASGKVLESIGMEFVRVNPRGFKKRGVWVEEREYKIESNRVYR